jgi:hypothetical protein
MLSLIVGSANPSAYANSTRRRGRVAVRIHACLMGFFLGILDGFVFLASEQVPDHIVRLVFLVFASLRFNRANG